MSSFVAALKLEIARLARKQARAECEALRKAAASHRSEIAALKRRLGELERLANRAGAEKARSARPSAPEESGGEGSAARFGAKSMRSQRKRLGLSAAEVGLLVGSSAQSVYNWEGGSARPQARHLEAILSLRTLGRREARAKLEAIAAAA